MNGERAERSSVIFQGDRLETAAKSAASITTQGSTVLIAANSAVVFGDSGIEIGRGGAVVNTLRGMPTRVAGLTITPGEGKQARYQVTEKDGQVLVAALHGSLTLRDAVGTTVLQEGGTSTQGSQTSDGVSAGTHRGFISEDKQLLFALLGVAVVLGIIAAVNYDESPYNP